MHVLIDAHLAVKEIDGIARYLIGLLSELPKLDRSIQYSILTLPDKNLSLPLDIFSHNNVKRIILDLMGPSPKQHFIMRRILKGLNVDLYHHPQFDLPFGVYVPKVVTIHDLTYIFHPEFFSKKNRLKRLYIKQSLKYSIRHADKIIAVSENTLADLRKLYEMPAERIKVIHHGVTAANLKFVEHQKLNVDLSNDFILFVGTRRPHKNIQGLIKALAILRKNKQTKLDLVVAGKVYSDFREPETLVEKLGLKEHVHFLGFVPDDQLPILYQLAKVVALPSFYEGFGFPVLEAMAYGKPVVTSNVTSLPEVLGNAGLLIEPHYPEDIACKIHRIVTDRQLSEQLSRKALNRSKVFSWQKVAESTLQVYFEALKCMKVRDGHTG